MQKEMCEKMLTVLTDEKNFPIITHVHAGPCAFAYFLGKNNV